MADETIEEKKIRLELEIRKACASDKSHTKKLSENDN